MAEGFGAQRRAATATNAAVLIGLATAVVIVLNLIVSQAYVRWDWTSDAVMQLSDRTQAFIDKLAKPLNLYVFYAPPAAYGAQTNRADEVYQVHHLAREYDLASDLITLQTLDPDSDRSRADELRERFGISRQEMAMGVVVFEYQGRVRYATDTHLFQTDMETLKQLQAQGRPVAGAPRLFQGEDVFTSAIVTLVEGGLPSVAILKGHGMAAPGEYDKEDPQSATKSALRLREALRRATFEVDVLDLQGHSQINKAYDCIIVAGPTEPLPATTIAALQGYLAGGGNLVVLAQPALDVRADGHVEFYKHGLDEFLEWYGVTLPEEIVLQHTQLPTGVRPYSANFFPRWDKDHPITRTMADPHHPVEFAQARPVEWNDKGRNRTTGQVIAHTDATGVRVNDLVGLRSESKKGPRARHEFLNQLPQGEQSVGVALATLKPAGDGEPNRLVVFGCRSFATDAQLAGAYDTDLLVNAVNWCAKREQLIGIGPKDARKVRFNLEPSELDTVFFLSVFGLPLAIAILGGIVWFVRRREGAAA